MTGETTRKLARGIAAATAILAVLLTVNVISIEPEGTVFACDLWQELPVETKRATVHDRLVADSEEEPRACLEANLDRFVEANDGFCRDAAGSAFGTPEVHAVVLEAERRKACS